MTTRTSRNDPALTVILIFGLVTYALFWLVVYICGGVF